MSNETKRTHSQDVDTYFGADLTAGMVWVDGYGNHFTIQKTGHHVDIHIVDGFLSLSADYTHTDLTLHPHDYEPMDSFTVTVDNAEEFDILRTN